MESDMPIISYTEFSKIVEKHVPVGHALWQETISKIFQYPQRYASDFSLTSPSSSIIRNIEQGRTIRFGYVIEEVLELYIARIGYTNLSKEIRTGTGKDDVLMIDQCFTDAGNENIYIIEQKMRDDHDSSKKRGQIDNFKKKITALHSLYPDKHMKAAMWFADATFGRNRKYYGQELSSMSNSMLETYLFYGREMFCDGFLGHPEIFDEMIQYIDQCAADMSDDAFLVAKEIDSNVNAAEAIANYFNFDVTRIRKAMSTSKYASIMRKVFPTKRSINGAIRISKEHNAQIMSEAT